MKKKISFEKRMKNIKCAEVAKIMHDTYEEKAKGFGWKTQDSCKVKFRDLPKKNMQVMLATAERVLDSLCDEDCILFERAFEKGVATEKEKWKKEIENVKIQNNIHLNAWNAKVANDALCFC